MGVVHTTCRTIKLIAVHFGEYPIYLCIPKNLSILPSFPSTFPPPLTNSVVPMETADLDIQSLKRDLYEAPAVTNHTRQTLPLVEVVRPYSFWNCAPQRFCAGQTAEHVNSASRLDCRLDREPFTSYQPCRSRKPHQPYTRYACDILFRCLRPS